MQELTKKLTEAFGPAGFEDDVRAAIREEIADLVDEMRVDALGNLIVHRHATGNGAIPSRRVMLAAHMDHLGLMVTHIDEHGFLRFTPVGGIYPLSCWGAQVRFADGTVGTVGLDGRIDPNDTVPSLDDMFIDVGATERSEVKQKVGDVAIFWNAFAAQGNAWFAPTMDDRIGCVVMVQLLRELKGVEISHDIHAVFTTQEELGLRGATTSAYALEPEIGIALDVTRTGDVPYATPAMAVSIGHGVAIKVKDSGMISHPGLNRLLIAAAEEETIPFQLEVLQRGTTDARNMQLSRAGMPATCLSLPSRHVHLSSQIVDRRDVESAVALLKAFLARPIEL